MLADGSRASKKDNLLSISVCLCILYTEALRESMIDVLLAMRALDIEGTPKEHLWRHIVAGCPTF